MFTNNWFQNLQVITPENKHRLSRKIIGIFPEIVDILICLDRWLILDFQHKESWPGFKNEDKEWKILDLKLGKIFGPFHPLDTTGSPRSWVEIDGEGVISFCWYEQGTAGSSDFDLNTGNYRSRGVGYGWDVDPLETVNHVPITNAEKYIRVSEKLNDSKLSDVLLLGKETLVNKALGDCLLITLHQDEQEVSIWYIG